jgi:hypothetical protein
MASLHFEIRHATGAAERLVVDSTRALVGSAAHCEIRLPADEAAEETLLVEARPDHVLITALASTPVPLVDGRVMKRGAVQPHSSIQIGSITLSVSFQDADGAVSRERPKTSPRTAILALLFAAAAAYAITMQDNTAASFDIPIDAPVLWPAKPVTCAHSNPVAALARAKELRLTTHGKRDRSPFVPRDGVAAVPMYREVAACFRVAGATTEARDAELAANRLETTMQNEYRLTQLRLERALSDQDFEAGLTQILVLKSMLENRTEEYVSNLSALERKLMLTSAKQEGDS